MYALSSNPQDLRSGSYSLCGRCLLDCLLFDWKGIFHLRFDSEGKKDSSPLSLFMGILG
jgi:hypothetical protein